MFRSEHPIREELHNELRAHPSLYLEADSDICHAALLGNDAMPALPTLLGDLDEPATTRLGKHAVGRSSGGRPKWEAHTSVLTFTFVAKFERLTQEPPEAFRESIDQVDGDVVAAVRVTVRGHSDEGRAIEFQADAFASSVGRTQAEGRGPRFRS